MTQTIIDPSLYCKFEENELVGLNVGYVDDLPRAGADECYSTDESLEIFETTGREELPLIFYGMRITDNEDMFHIN